MIAEWRNPQKQRGTYAGLMDAVDAVLDNLEELHLRDRHRVPTAYVTHLEHLAEMLPADVRCELRTGIPIVRLMDTLYDIQGNLMARRSARRLDRAMPRRMERPVSIPGFTG
jgi:hypothetical protein